MSGGVDSSVTAALLHEQGHEVIGVTLRLHAGCSDPGPRPERSCCTAADVRDAARVAQHLGVGFHTLDARKVFAHRVVADTVDEYARGRTPNPCVRCNEWIKFELLLRWARDRGADALATGHYARLQASAGAGMRLRRGQDRAKDQSYFLFRTPREALPLLRFPLGELTKEEVRAIAARLGLPVARKAESQDICFAPPGGLGELVGAVLADEGRDAGPGPVIDERGKTLGSHKGLYHYTVGQRRGLGVATGRRLYVRALDVPGNRLLVGPRESCRVRMVGADGARWLGVPPAGGRFPCVGQIRYTHRGTAGEASVSAAGDRFTVRFETEVSAPAPGQALVLYRDDEVIGGGWIVSREPA